MATRRTVLDAVTAIIASCAEVTDARLVVRGTADELIAAFPGALPYEWLADDGNGNPPSVHRWAEVKIHGVSVVTDHERRLPTEDELARFADLATAHTWRGMRP